MIISVRLGSRLLVDQVESFIPYSYFLNYLFLYLLEMNKLSVAELKKATEMLERIIRGKVVP